MSMAQIAVERLRDLGVPSGDISIIAREVEHVVAEPAAVGATSATASGMATGGVFGGLAGLLVGLGTLAIPGIGPVIAAGPLLGALGGAAIGAATGGLLGSLMDLGVPEEYATTYVTEVERGQVLVTVTHRRGHPHPGPRSDGGSGCAPSLPTHDGTGVERSQPGARCTRAPGPTVRLTPRPGNLNSLSSPTS